MGCLYQLIHLLPWYFFIIMWCISTTYAFNSRSSFARSLMFLNYKLTVTQSLYKFTPTYIPKENFSEWDRMKCVDYCARDSRCLAFNFYESGLFYICEYLEQNYCRNTLSKALVYWPGNSVWEKLGRSNASSCLDKYNNATACSSLKPGCVGTWPNCNNCSKTCRDENFRNGYPGYYNTTVWPYGASSRPVFACCYANMTIFIRRNIDAITGEVTRDFKMSFSDVSHIYSLKQYTVVRFTFFCKDTTYSISANYNTSSIAPDGTLVNVKPDPSVVRNPLNFRTGSPKNFSFVSVTDDRYNCGSFWLVDSSNATYCPGGNVSIFGKPIKMANTTVVSTGISLYSVPCYGTDVSLIG